MHRCLTREARAKLIRLSLALHNDGPGYESSSAYCKLHNDFMFKVVYCTDSATWFCYPRCIYTEHVRMCGGEGDGDGEETPAGVCAHVCLGRVLSDCTNCHMQEICILYLYKLPVQPSPPLATNFGDGKQNMQVQQQVDVVVIRANQMSCDECTGIAKPKCKSVRTSTKSPA